jgi:protein required for attachment to host cells
MVTDEAGAVIDPAQRLPRMRVLVLDIALTPGTVMKTQWIVIANAVSARIFRRDTAKSPLVPVVTLTHDASRLHARDLESDRPGSQAADNSQGLNHFEPRSDARRKEHQRFAKEIALRLDAGLKVGEYASLTLFASNPFMGELKAQLSEAVTQRLKATLNNDLSHVGIAELESRISGSWSAVL